MPLLLAIEDSTSLSYEHSVREELGLTGNNSLAKKRGNIVHTTMLMDAGVEILILSVKEIIEQKRHMRIKKVINGKRIVMNYQRD